MAGLYIHVPFCVRKCGYCDFYSVPETRAGLTEYIRSLINEISLRADKLSRDEAVRTIYFGGGTPSLLSPGQLDLIFKKIQQTFRVSNNPEISIEVNPGAVSQKALDAYRDLGIHRISVGVQSFHDYELEMLGRIHSARTALQFIRHLKETGWENVGIDLIYGLPEQSVDDWKKTLKKTADLRPAHISAYALSWSPGTVLGRRITNGELPEPDEDRISDMYLFTHDYLARMDYEHYEISNFARPGFRCAHNEAYWTGADYLGFGPSAHSFCQNRRFWNTADVKQYNSVLLHNQLPVAGEEFLTKKQQILEKMALGLRRKEGVPVSDFGNGEKLNELVKKGLALMNKGRLTLTARGFLLADELAVYLTP